MGDGRLVRELTGGRHVDALDGRTDAARSFDSAWTRMVLEPHRHTVTVTPQQWAAQLGPVLAGLPVYYVTAGMCEFARAATVDLPHHPVSAAHLPTPTGWLWLASPLRLVDDDDVPLVRAVAWQLSGDTVQLLLFGERELTPPETLADLERSAPPMPRLPLHNISEWPLGAGWTDRDDLVPGEPPADLRGVVLDGGTTADIQLVLRARLAVLWALMAQPIGRPAVVADRMAARRAVRGGSGDDTAIRVVLLRRQVPRDPDVAAGVEQAADLPRWSHRWVVSGHWRRQWYPSEDTHRLIWIDAHVKGPDGAPLKDDTAVRVLAR